MSSSCIETSVHVSRSIHKASSDASYAQKVLRERLRRTTSMTYLSVLHANVKCRSNAGQMHPPTEWGPHLLCQRIAETCMSQVRTFVDAWICSHTFSERFPTWNWASMSHPTGEWKHVNMSVASRPACERMILLPPGCFFNHPLTLYTCRSLSHLWVCCKKQSGSTLCLC